MTNTEITNSIINAVTNSESMPLIAVCGAMMGTYIAYEYFHTTKLAMANNYNSSIIDSNGNGISFIKQQEEKQINMQV
ncbi:MAG: hypothetical protein J6I76_14645 [Oribacterium sp.]|nr:hypothetical protein [Oribacterium sp.]